MAIQPLDPQCDFQQPGDALVLVAQQPQPGFAIDRLLQRHRLGGIVRDQFRDFVDLAERQAEHAADIAHRRAGLKFAESNDLRNAVAAVFVSNVVDDAVAAFLAEVDVEVGHRHALGIEEALEQQTEAQRIEVGDGQRPGGHRSGARAAPGPHRNALRLGPLDEIGDDQEVAGEAHRGDDRQLVVQPLAVDRAGSPRRRRRHPSGAAALRSPWLGRFPPRRSPARTLGQMGSSGLRVSAMTAQRRAIGQRVVAGLGQVGEQGAHVGGRLEPVLRRDAAAVGFGQRAALGDAQQRVMRLMHVGGGEVAVVGRDERHAARVGQRNQSGLDRRLVGEAVAMQLLHRASRERFRQRIQQPLGFRLLPLGQQAADRAGGATGQQQQAGGVSRRCAQTAIAASGSGRCRGTPSTTDVADWRARWRPVPAARSGRRQAALSASGQRDLAADDRLDALAGAVLGEFERAEQIAGVGDRGGRHVPGLRQGRRSCQGRSRPRSASRRSGCGGGRNQRAACGHATRCLPSCPVPPRFDPLTGGASSP